MFLPDKFELKEVRHGHGDGMWFYDFKDTAGLGVHVHQRSDKQGHRIQWMHVALPEMKFASLESLRAALVPVTHHQIDTEAAKWPQLKIEPEAPTLNNRCRLCPREPHIRATHRVTVMLSWIETGHYAGLCDEHAGLAGQPQLLIAALDAEVEARRQRWAQAQEGKQL